MESVSNGGSCLFSSPYGWLVVLSFLFSKSKRAMRWLMSLLVLGLSVAAVYFQLPAVAYYWVQTQLHASSGMTPSIGLQGYRAVVQHRPVHGLERNLSGLTFSTHTDTLFGTINRPPRVVELTSDGDLLRTITVHGAKDIEAITHIEGERFMLADERNSTIYTVDIPAGARTVQAQDPLVLQLDTLHNNLGVEALSWDSERHLLLVGQEKWPLRLLSLQGTEGVAPTGRTPASRIRVREWSSDGLGSLFINDLASVTTHAGTGNLLLLSEESAMVVEYTRQGNPVDMMLLWPGTHGLAKKIPQPEGITLAPDGRLFIVSEPNLFYRFETAAKELPAGKEGQ